MSKKKSDKIRKRNPKSVEITSPEGERAKEAALARTYLRPTVLAAATIKGQYASEDQVNINALIEELGTQVSLVHGGNLGRAEAMLVTQAHTLDALFAELISRARINMGQYPDAVNKYMNLALRSQSQCRATLEALAEIKNPRPYIQHNKAQYQQVNNGGQPQSNLHAQAGENLKSTNGLLEDNTHEWMDTGAQETASGNNKELETVGEKYGAEDGSG